MHVGPAQGLRSRLGDEARAALGHDLLARLPTATAVQSPHGAIAFFLPQGGVLRRTLEQDRHGNVLAMLRWDTGRLDAAWLRIPDGAWLRLEPRAITEAPWGLSDRLWWTERPGAPERAVTVFEALDYTRLDRIPTLAEPAVLPGGSGAVVLNLLATLAADQASARLVYDGPYPTEQLFLALLESFVHDGASDDPLADFMSGHRLAWRPEPHERLFTPGGAYLQFRDRLEKVVWQGRTYYRADWQRVIRHAPRRIADTPRGAVCGLWALGRPVEEHLVVSAGGDVAILTVAEPPREEPRALAGAVVAGIGAVIAATGAPALRPFVGAEMSALGAEWAPVAGDLFEASATTLRFSPRLRGALAERLAAAATAEERAHAGLAALTEMAMLAADVVRARAQSRLLALDAASQTAALTSPPPPAPETARLITDAVAALLADPGRGEP